MEKELIFWGGIVLGFGLALGVMALTLLEEAATALQKLLPRYVDRQAFRVIMCIFLIAIVIAAFYRVGNAEEVGARHAVPEGIRGEPPFNEAVSIDTDAARQVVFKYDRDDDGKVDYIVRRASIDVIPVGLPCLDFDPDKILIPRMGYYLVLREPTDVIIPGPVVDVSGLPSPASGLHEFGGPP